MKKLIFVLSLCVLTLLVNNPVSAQNKGKAITQAVDTLKGAETVAFEAIRLTGGWNLVMQALVEEIGGTADCTLFIEGSVDGTSYQRITWKEDNRYQFFSSDSANVARQGSEFTTVADAASCSATIQLTDFQYFRWKGTGTSGDTCIIHPKYIFKKIE